MTCEICGRNFRDEHLGEDGYPSATRCWQGDCYRIAYEREKTRAEKAEGRLAALEMPRKCDHCGLTNGHLVGCRYGASP